MQAFQFKDKTFEFPIEVYVYYPKQLIIFLSVILMLFCTTVLTVSVINAHLFGILIVLFFVVIITTLAFLYKKPRFIIYPDKLVFTEHGLIKPKELSWQDCILHATFDKHHATKKEIALLYFYYQDNKNEMQRFACLNLNNIRFDGCHFDKDDTLKFFEQIKLFSEKS